MEAAPSHLGGAACPCYISCPAAQVHDGRALANRDGHAGFSLETTRGQPRRQPPILPLSPARTSRSPAQHRCPCQLGQFSSSVLHASCSNSRPKRQQFSALRPASPEHRVPVCSAYHIGAATPRARTVCQHGAHEKMATQTKDAAAPQLPCRFPTCTVSAGYRFGGFTPVGRQATRHSETESRRWSARRIPIPKW